MRCPSCQAIWLAPGTGRISRSASDRSSTYRVSRSFVEPRADLIASRPVMRIPSWKKDTEESLHLPRPSAIVEREMPRSTGGSHAARHVDFFRGGLLPEAG